jgi:response regulator of citrate/malate metabolism
MGVQKTKGPKVSEISLKMGSIRIYLLKPIEFERIKESKA